MSLRLRLIVAFFLLSVVPLGAVTFYSYLSNERALRVAAQHETELLTGELTQRMQVVTTQVSDRVERLMDMPMTAATPTGTSGTSGTSATSRPPTKTSQTRTVARNTTRPSTAPAAPAAPSAPAAPAAAPAPVTVVDSRGIEGQVAASLGEVALLLNNVEFRGLGRMGGGFNAPNATGGRGGRGGAPLDAAAAEAALRAGTLPRSAPNQTPPPAGRADAPRDGAPQQRAEGPSDSAGRRGGPPGQPGQRYRYDGPPRGRPPGDAGAASGQRGDTWIVSPDADPTHMKIDMAPIRRELYRELAPGGSLDQLTPEERQRIGREVNQRMLGIVQGMQLSAAEIQKKVELAKQQAAQTAASAEGKASAAAGGEPPAPPAAPPPVSAPMAGAPIPPVEPPALPAATAPKPPSIAVVRPATPAPSAAKAAPAAPQPAPAPQAQPAPRPMTRKAALTGTQLNVRLESGGEVVKQVNAEINLPNLLATVFANTRRDSGEIPFAVGKDGHLYAPTDADRARLGTLDVSRVDDTPGTKRVGDWIVVTMPDKTGAGLRFGIARPVGNLLSELRRTTARNAGFGLLFIAVALVGIVPLSGRLTRNLTTLTEGVGRIAQGEYHTRVNVKSADEIGRLAAAFNQMAADVEQHQRSAVEQERIRRELELGRRIQFDMLPHAPLHFGLTEVKGVSVPAREVGGDFFNYFALDSGLVALLVGDVSGKGVGAALLMANIQASLRTRFALGQGLSAIADAIDRDIEANSPGPVYATLFIAIFDPATRLMRYVNAGHNPQYVRRGDGRLEKMSSTGMPVGLLAGHGYSEREVQLTPGDLLFFYTDGCVEMENESAEMFGAERLESLVAASGSGNASEVLVTVEQAIATFRGGRDLFDDATMMAVTVG
jgi:serine phosphatase RsbU (regulator of sigma subunit)